MNLASNKDYNVWLFEIKTKIYSAQIKASIAVNSELIMLYWELGKSIVDRQENLGWGSSVISQLAKDLKSEYPDLKGFSERNLRLCKQFYKYYGDEFIKWQQLVAKIPWGHNVLIFSKIKDISTALFYLQKTIENNWSRNILEIQIESNLFSRQGKAFTNFENTLPKPQSDLAKELIKNPYYLDFLGLDEAAHEKLLEDTIFNNLTSFMIELGKGFAFVGRQFKIEVSQKEYFIDLLFYHLDLRCFVVIELKTVPFQPEFAGKMNFYLSAVDDLLKKEYDNQTIGIILCKSGKNIEVEYTLRDINKPIGVSNFTLLKSIPKNFLQKLPSIEEFENEFAKYQTNK